MNHKRQSAPALGASQTVNERLTTRSLRAYDSGNTETSLIGMAKKPESTAPLCAVCKLPVPDTEAFYVQIPSGQRVHLECRPRDAKAREQTRLKS